MKTKILIDKSIVEKVLSASKDAERALSAAWYNKSEGFRLQEAILLLEEEITKTKKQEWVSLSLEERSDCLVLADPCECLAEPEAYQLITEVESMLKEKNTFYLTDR